MHQASTLAFEQLYRASYKIVLKKKGHQLWEHVTAFEKEWFANNVLPLIAKLVTDKIVAIATGELAGVGTIERKELGEKFLRGLKEAWEEHQMAMNMITDILMYMDRNMMTDARKPSIFTSTIGLYRENVLLATPQNIDIKIIDLINAVIIDMINIERRGDLIDRSIIRSVCSMLEMLHKTDEQMENEKLYITIFDPFYIGQSRKFYLAECQELLAQQNCSYWLEHTRRRLVEEEDRCRTTLAAYSRLNIAKVVEEELFSKPLSDFLALESTGLRAMIDNDRYEDLSTLYQLLLRVDKKVGALTEILEKRVVEMGLEIEKSISNLDFSEFGNHSGDAEDGAHEKGDKGSIKPMTIAAQATLSALKWVDDVLALKRKYDTMLTECFMSDVIVESSLTKAFADFVNIFPRASEFISLYIDSHLKKDLKDKTDAEVEYVLEGAVTLFKYLQDRDLFERYYQKHLAKRLLTGKSQHEEAEQAIITKMRATGGNSYTSKFEGMFKDIAISVDLRKSFKNYMQAVRDEVQSGDSAKEYQNIDLVINVLTSNNWPADIMNKSSVGETTNIIYPQAIQKIQNSFCQYYSKGRSGRILTWLPSVSTAEIKAWFPKMKESGPLSRERRYDITVSTYAMIVILLFNNKDNDEWVSFESIQDQTKIPTAELQRALASISIPPKFRILLKEPATKTVKNTDKFCYNASFHSKVLKVRVPLGQASRVESREERKCTEEKNNETRANACSAAIVRILKYVFCSCPV